jgi:hypothetical protein
VRLPFPVRIPYKGAIAFGCFLLVIQLFEGTTATFALGSFAFILVATATFNLAGGFTRPSGSYVFFYAVLGVILGLCVKAILGEAADSNLLAPKRTILVFLAGICAMYGAVFVSRKLRPASGLLEGLVTDKNLQNATMGCLVTGFAVHMLILSAQAASSSAGAQPAEGSIVTALAQINRFLPMAVILGTIYQIRKSGGTSSINLPVLLAGADIFASGLLGFSKEAIFTPFACWLAAAASQNYKFSRFQVLGLVAGFSFMVFYLVPYSQYGRNYEKSDTNPNITDVERATYLLSNLPYVREQYKENQSTDMTESRTYFNQDVGFFDRLQMISVDDELIDSTEKTGPFGLLPIYMGVGNLVPHFIWPNKPIPIGGNTYAHEIGGIIPDDDVTTGISFTPTGEAYHLQRWLGVIFLAPAMWILLFTLFDSLCGDVRAAPWGLLIVVYFGHLAPEGMLGGIIYAMGYAAFGLIVAALSAAYVMPILGTLIKGPERTVVKRVGPVRSIPRRPRPLASPESGT